MTRAGYYRTVILKSLRKRWIWLLAASLLVFLAAWTLLQALLVAVASGLLALALLSSYVAWSSLQRHKYEYPS